MQIHCRCKSCQKKFKVDAKMAGRTLHCSKCGGDVVVPPMAASLDDEDDEHASLLEMPAVSAGDAATGSSARLRKPSSGGSSARHPAVAPRKKSQTPMIIAGVVGLLVLGGGALVVLSMSRDPMLILEWPVADRSDASLTVDRKEIPLTAEMPMRVPVAPGKHRVMIRRRGFEPVEWEIDLGRGETKPLRPEWKSLPTVEFE